MDFGLIAFIVIITMTGILAFDSVRLRLRIKQINQQIIQSAVDQMALRKSLEKMIANENNKNVEKTEGFLKFVSESREWAFKYIEEVQMGIAMFVEELKPTVEHYRNTKRALYRKQSETLDKLLHSYDILIKFLPENTKVDNESEK